MNDQSITLKIDDEKDFLNFPINMSGIEKFSFRNTILKTKFPFQTRLGKEDILPGRFR